MWLERQLAALLESAVPAEWLPYVSWLPPFVVTAVMVGIVFGAILTAVAYGVLVERWVSARVQNRLGPNRVGPFGLLHPLVDGLKPLLKEDLVPPFADRKLFVLAPALAAGTTLLSLAVVPFGPGPTADPTQPMALGVASSLDVGLLYVFAVGSLAVYGVVLAGWSSNNKYGVLGAVRSSAQVISYEIPLGMSVVGVILFAGSMSVGTIVERQAAAGLLGWNLWWQPLAFLLFMVSALAEATRVPFDLPECEQELVAGYHSEYSGMKFAMFMLAEYVHMILAAFLLSCLFLGGWHFPVIAEATSVYPFSWLVKVGVLAAKAVACVLFFMMLRWTIPRFRYDQLMSLAWKGLLPLAIANLSIIATVKQFGLPTILIPILSVATFVVVSVFAAERSRRAVLALPRAA